MSFFASLARFVFASWLPSAELVWCNKTGLYDRLDRESPSYLLICIQRTTMRNKCDRDYSGGREFARIVFAISSLLLNVGGFVPQVPLRCINRVRWIILTLECLANQRQWSGFGYWRILYKSMMMMVVDNVHTIERVINRRAFSCSSLHNVIVGNVIIICKNLLLLWNCSIH